jgi:hypothetical protein
MSGLWSSGLWQSVALWVNTNVSEEHGASIFILEDQQQITKYPNSSETLFSPALSSYRPLLLSAWEIVANSIFYSDSVGLLTGHTFVSE